MGIDILDINFRLEKRYAIELDWEAWKAIASKRQPPDITAGELCDLVKAQLEKAGQPIPYSLWHGVQLSLASALSVHVDEIRPEALLIKDLRAS